MAELTTTPCRQSRNKLLQSAGQKLDPITSNLKPLLFQKEDQTNAGLTRTGIHRDIFVQHNQKRGRASGGSPSSHDERYPVTRPTALQHWAS